MQMKQKAKENLDFEYNKEIKDNKSTKSLSTVKLKYNTPSRNSHNKTK